MFEIRYDKAKLRRLERELRDFGKTALPRVMSRALTRTASSARTETARLLAKRTGLKIKDVRRRIFLQKASYANWRSAITISRRRWSLQLLNPKKTSKGLKVKHQRKRVLIRAAFPVLKRWYMRLPAAGGYKGTIGVEEAIEIGPQKKVGRLPVARIKGPILSDVFVAAQDEAQRIYQQSLGKLEKNINDQVRLILKRRLPV